jgi:hypothetical protein
MPKYKCLLPLEECLAFRIRHCQEGQHRMQSCQGWPQHLRPLPLLRPAPWLSSMAKAKARIGSRAFARRLNQ